MRESRPERLKRGEALEYEFTVDGELHRVKIDPGSLRALGVVDGREYEFDWRKIHGGIFSILIDGRSHAARVVTRDGGLTVWVDGHQFSLDRGASDDRTVAAGLASAAAGGTIKAPMPGAVVKVLVSEGDRVEVNQSLVIVEAMKMENEVRSPFEGVVSKVNVSPGDSVGTTEAMLEIEPA